jgi:hypothetical protein
MTAAEADSISSMSAATISTRKAGTFLCSDEQSCAQASTVVISCLPLIWIVDCFHVIRVCKIDESFAFTDGVVAVYR